ncbi:hypothetical protein SmJEL517_g01849 [Synchytrium microbalum]|uniref:FAM50A/XAP5 C-terminal domain-containing protein n=1 Tax=Synchytrium microbalum TaxID=1806994 RepID=A0A507C8G4_9FUNG|nr:uncharacterized protein SmJEL517_g01849 [Synchytrium microbalum]TPX35912.1 hypothetical protein SmJEL517_g01849 [Synchytrium microbalum]
MADSVAEQRRLAQLEKQRSKDVEELQRRKNEIQKSSNVKVGSDRFVSHTNDADDELKRQTVGLVRLEDFQRIRDNIDKARQDELEKGRSIDKVSKKKRKPESKAKLSFGDDLEEGGDGGADVEDDDERTSKKLKKNPHVDTSFLPDREREEEDRRERDNLKREWEQDQQKIKDEAVTITYSYWDGSGHRKSVEVLKGDTISKFLEKCRLQWHELRGVHVDNLMYVKEDLIIPHHYTFYDFIINKTRGKSGPLFNFEVKDDVRLINDATKETEDSHAGKVMERSWYEHNKHIFPASRWEIFDPQKMYGKYSVKDMNKMKLEQELLKDALLYK